MSSSQLGQIICESIHIQQSGDAMSGHTMEAMEGLQVVWLRQLGQGSHLHTLQPEDEAPLKRG